MRDTLHGQINGSHIFHDRQHNTYILLKTGWKVAQTLSFHNRHLNGNMRNGSALKVPGAERNDLSLNQILNFKKRGSLF